MESNPEIGMQDDSFESVEATPETNTGSDDFFNALEQEVNGGIIDDTEVTQRQSSGSEQVTHANQDNGSEYVESQSSDGTDWKKRYEDSSREAIRLKDKYKDVEPFMPVLDAMKNDSGLVDHVRNYLVEGGKPAKSIQEKLNLDEDFVFDQQEAMTDPDSDSAKVMNAHVDSLVQQRVGQMAEVERQRAQQIQGAQQRKSQEVDFMKRNNMSEQDFIAFKKQAQSHVMTLDDINYLLNRDKAAANVAQSTKADMLNQMKNTRNMPTSASGANSQGESKSADRTVFEDILGFESGTDNLFG